MIGGYGYRVTGNLCRCVVWKFKFESNKIQFQKLYVYLCFDITDLCMLLFFFFVLVLPNKKKTDIFL